jgi:hypothetical protein
MAKYYKLNDKARVILLLHVSLADLIVPVNEMRQRSAIDYNNNNNNTRNGNINKNTCSNRPKETIQAHSFMITGETRSTLFLFCSLLYDAICISLCKMSCGRMNGE